MGRDSGDAAANRTSARWASSSDYIGLGLLDASSILRPLGTWTVTSAGGGLVAKGRQEPPRGGGGGGAAPGERHAVAPELDRRRVATGQLGLVADPGGPLGECAWRRTAADVAVGQTPGAPDRRLGPSPDPNRRRGTADGLRGDVQAGLGIVEVAPIARDPPVPPGLAEDRDRPLEPTSAGSLRHAEALELLGSPAQAETQDEPTVREQVDGRGVLGQPGGGAQ